MIQTIYYHQPSKLVSDMPYDGSNQALHSNKVNKVSENLKK